MGLKNRIMTILLNLQTIFRYVPQIEKAEFRSEILAIDKSNNSWNILKVSAKKIFLGRDIEFRKK
jgi:hypothetical protein